MDAIIAGSQIQDVGSGQCADSQCLVHDDSDGGLGQLDVGDRGVVNRGLGASDDIGCTFGPLQMSLNVKDFELVDSSSPTTPTSIGPSNVRLSIGKTSPPKTSPPHAGSTSRLSKPQTDPPLEASESALLVRSAARLPTFGKEPVLRSKLPAFGKGDVFTTPGREASPDDLRAHPPSFYCPISHQCMHDPVVLADGHTYERRHIERWLKSNATSPVCGMTLSRKDVFPNHALRNAIEEYFTQVLDNHKEAIRQATAGFYRGGHYDSNEELLQTIDSLMQCAILMNADLSVELVLKRIMGEARLLVGAEAFSVFLVDRESQELCSTVNSTGGELRIPIQSGIAGHVACSRTPLIIHDAYGDARFNSAVDTKTGFKTRSILCVPIMGGMKGGIIGVAQLVNKTDSGILRGSVDATVDFTEDDLRFFQVLAAQAGAAIVNSGMFECVPPLASERRQPSTDRSSPSWTADCEVGRAVQRCPATKYNESDRSLQGVVSSAVVRQTSFVKFKPARSCTLQPLLLAAAEKWEMDTLTLAELSDNKPLSVLAEHLFECSGVIKHFGLDAIKLKLFLETIQAGYLDSNPYHNKAHAASVVHFMYLLLSRGGVAEAVSLATFDTIEGDKQRRWNFVMLAGLLAATIHDFEHDGVNNQFLVSTASPKAIRYNDKSPNENHHVAAGFDVLLKPECNFLEGFVSKEYLELRRMVIEMVLATDMAQTDGLVMKFQDVTAGSGGTFAPACSQDATLALQMALKCADLGHLALGWSSHMRWVRRLEQEFFAQGDQEKKLNMPEVSFLMDCEKPGISETQHSFFNFVALPLFRTFVGAFDGALPMLLAVEENYRQWLGIGPETQLGM